MYVESQNHRQGKGMGTVVRSYQEGVCISYAVVWPNINTEMNRVVSGLQWDRGV